VRETAVLRPGIDEEREAELAYAVEPLHIRMTKHVIDEVVGHGYKAEHGVIDYFPFVTHVTYGCCLRSFCFLQAKAAAKVQKKIDICKKKRPEGRFFPHYAFLFLKASAATYIKAATSSTTGEPMGCSTS
jgi:hypothetical protein